MFKIKGICKDSDGSLIVNEFVTITNNNPSSIEPFGFETDENGEFELLLPSGFTYEFPTDKIVAITEAIYE